MLRRSQRPSLFCVPARWRIEDFAGTGLAWICKPCGTGDSGRFRLA